MSITYYIADKNKKDEYEKFRKFWEDELFPEFIDKIYEYCSSVDGEIVNQDLAEGIAEDNLCGYSSVPLSETKFEEVMVTVNHAGVFWRKCVVEGNSINSLEELIKFFSKKEHQEHYLVLDENGRGYRINELMELLK